MVKKFKTKKLFDAGVAAYIMYNFRKSVRLLSQVIKLDPKFALAYVSRGAAHLKLNKLNKAIADFSAAIELNPKYARAHYLRGLAFDKQNQTARAYLDFVRTIEIDPNFSAAYRSRDSVLAKKETAELEMEDFELISHLTAMRVAQFLEEDITEDVAI
jgi:tetratricopeptide (TPR) repeat protein